tara:strand:- start:464 stop:1258 length:795 start_codon:yes stop_codon:yes gene_type:complete
MSNVLFLSGNGDIMQEIDVDFGPSSPRILCLTAPVTHYELNEVPLADADEVAKFATKKRYDEHLSGRFLLEKALSKWGVNTSLIEVRRNQFRAPSIAFLPGIWIRQALPSISIGHSRGRAFVALVENGWTIGIDAEPLDLEISSGVFDMMSKGNELVRLRAHPDLSLALWTGKEAIQKAARMGMHLNPRDIEIPIGIENINISIDNLNFQLKSLTKNGFFISVSIGCGNGYDSNPEDELLDLTLEGMINNPGWSVGCNTTRDNL